jgi:hypothetical protein
MIADSFTYLNHAAGLVLKLSMEERILYLGIDGVARCLCQYAKKRHFCQRIYLYTACLLIVTNIGITKYPCILIIYF